MKKLLAILLFPFPVMAGPATMFGLPYDGTNNEYPAKVNSSGQLTISLLAGEDQTNDVMKVEGQYNVCIDDADVVCKSSAGFVHSVWCYGEDAAATAGRVRVLNATAAGAAETTEVWGSEFAAAIASPSGQVLDVIMDTGIVIDWTTTADVKCGVSYR